MRLFCSEKQILAETEKLYCEAVAFYYELLKDRNELWIENLLTIQGQLEKLTVPGKDGRVPEYLPPGGKLPVYFRRSAMNKASMAVKTAAASGCFPQKIEANITFFKGMQKEKRFPVPKVPKEENISICSLKLKTRSKIFLMKRKNRSVRMRPNRSLMPFGRGWKKPPQCIP